DPDAPMPDSAALQAIVDARVSSEIADSMSVYIVDALTGDVLLDHKSAVARTPASTTKLISGLLAIELLGPDRTLSTTVVTGSDDEIFLVGGGDVLLGVGENEPGELVGRAGLGTLAEQTERHLALKGASSVRVRLDDSLFEGDSIHPSWNPDLVSAHLAPPITAIAVNEGRRREPEYKDASSPPRYKDLPMDAAQVFVAALEERGITVEGDIKRSKAPKDGQVVASVESASILEIARQALLASDNVLADSLARLIAIEIGYPATFSGGAQAMMHQLNKIGLDTTGVKLVDGSGLSPDARITPKLEVELVQYALERPEIMDGVARLPIAGLSGTLSSRMQDSSAAGVVRAKTGGLTGVRSLAGTIVTQDQRLLIFSMMADPNFPDGGWIAQRNIDSIAQDIAACGCRDANAHTG
ncbi:MAG TPA: D-alanyl-D-alanine carboxypeptidase/D-alanyl-D-alanine-endopeptidase, partial [Actinomycetales bacterium]|nr:D-alanyl-D-alanine carboxypeptidase/D-alanyl-D-alanine-endopeptidase [Actinomycetales bacterium]